MAENRRRDKRRYADLALKETVEILQILERISRGEEADFTERYADLVGMKDRLGRRQEDRKLGESLCATIEAIASNLGQLVGKERRLRKVRITKMSGERSSQMQVQTSVVGWEENRPQVGKSYRLFKDDGGLFRSARVIKVTPDYFQTQNSVYRIEVLREG